MLLSLQLENLHIIPLAQGVGEPWHCSYRPFRGGGSVAEGQVCPGEHHQLVLEALLEIMSTTQCSTNPALASYLLLKPLPGGEGFLCWAELGQVSYLAMPMFAQLQIWATSWCPVSPDFVCIQSSAAPKRSSLLFLLLLLTTEYYFMHLYSIKQLQNIRSYGNTERSAWNNNLILKLCWLKTSE